MPIKLAAACNTCDKKACVALTCLPFDTEQGKPDEFRACAKARNLTFGSDWALMKGTSVLTPSETAELLTLDVGKGVKIDLHQRCVRQKIGTQEVLGSDAPATQSVDVVKGGAGKALKITYLPADYTGFARSFPRFTSLYQLADHVCEK
jgi:hypothetical protein